MKSAQEKKKKEPRKAVGFIAVSIGEGMNEIFRELEWTISLKAVRQ